MSTILDTHCTCCNRQQCTNCVVFVQELCPAVDEGKPVDKRNTTLSKKVSLEESSQGKENFTAHLKKAETEVSEYSPSPQDEEGSRYATSESDVFDSWQDDEQLDDDQGTENLSPFELQFITSPTSMLMFAWLYSLRYEPYYEIIFEVCADFFNDQPVDGENIPPQDSSAPPNSTENSLPRRTRRKRKASDLEGEDANSASPTTTTETPLAKIRTKPKFACHFWKMNQHLYAECGHAGYGKVCHLAEHLRKEHSLKNYSCRMCWRPFDNAEALIAHNGDTSGYACRPTGGTPVHRLKISKAHMGDCKKWFWIWESLFPLIKEKPKSPYWEPLNPDEQLFSSQRDYLAADLVTRLPPETIWVVMDSLTRFYD
ncbi:hypothetical protein M434DRAFT_17792 [Hypoxylon sp. CO27-5]|nr:hypothetical protein M434DRAFT_17792 [Hypoxylon sp. CO27-5]